MDARSVGFCFIFHSDHGHGLQARAIHYTMPDDSQAFLTEWKGKSIDGILFHPSNISLLTSTFQRSSNKSRMEQHCEYVFSCQKGIIRWSISRWLVYGALVHRPNKASLQNPGVKK
jgi:hypothetical protein